MWTPPHIRATRARDKASRKTSNVEPDPRHLSPVQSLRWAYHLRRESVTEMSVAVFILAATAAVEPAVISTTFTTHLSRK